MDKLINPIAEVLSSLGSPSHQFAENIVFLKDVIKLILSIIKNVLT